MKRAILGAMVLWCGCAWAQAETGQAAPCTRQALQAAVDSYLEAQERGDPALMPLAPQADFRENMAPVGREQGLWNTPLPIGFHRSILDVDSCRTFTEVIATESDPPRVVGTRLTLRAGRISEIDSLVTDGDDWLFDAGRYLRYSAAEDWRALDAAERVDRRALVAGADAYLDHFADREVRIPYGTPCARLEGGMYTTLDFDDPNATCAIGFPVDRLPVIERSYVVDADLGTVNVFCRFGHPPGAPDSHTFRLVNGKLRYIHTLTVSVPGVSFERILGLQPR